jgi:hypothetical protein
MPRREALKWLATAAAGMTLTSLHGAPALPNNGTPPSAPHGQRIGADPALTKPYKPGDLWPLSFSPAQRAAAAALADLIIPPEKGDQPPSALGVPDFIDEWISSYYDETIKDRPIILEGLTWIDQESQRRFQKAFAQLTVEQQSAIADDICGVKPVKKELRTAENFFKRFRYLAAGGYYTTPQGMRDIGYRGNRPSATFDGPTPEALKHLGLE